MRVCGRRIFASRPARVLRKTTSRSAAMNSRPRIRSFKWTRRAWERFVPEPHSAVCAPLVFSRYWVTAAALIILLTRDVPQVACRPMQFQAGYERCPSATEAVLFHGMWNTGNCTQSAPVDNGFLTEGVDYAQYRRVYRYISQAMVPLVR